VEYPAFLIKYGKPFNPTYDLVFAYTGRGRIFSWIFPSSRREQILIMAKKVNDSLALDKAECPV